MLSKRKRQCCYVTVSYGSNGVPTAPIWRHKQQVGKWHSSDNGKYHEMVNKLKRWIEASIPTPSSTFDNTVIPNQHKCAKAGFSGGFWGFVSLRACLQGLRRMLTDGCFLLLLFKQISYKEYPENHLANSRLEFINQRTALLCSCLADKLKYWKRIIQTKLQVMVHWIRNLCSKGGFEIRLEYYYY